MTEPEAHLSCCGWLVTETIERMFDKGFAVEDICEALDLPTPEHLYYLLSRAQTERDRLLGGLDNGEDV